MENVRVGIIGCGWAGIRHAEAIRTLSSKIDLIAACDIDPDRAETFAAAHGIDICSSDYSEILNRETLDAVSICLPHNLHADIAVHAARAGLHVLVEKPLCTTLEEADRMIEAAKRSSVLLMVAETVRYRTLPRKVAGLLNDGAIGKPFMFRISRESFMHSELINKPWLLKDRSGGIMYAAGIHEIDLLRLIAGEVEHVYALDTLKTVEEMTGDETSVAMLRLKSGAVGLVLESFSIKTDPSGVSGIVHGENGTLKFARNVISIYTADKDGQPEQEQQIPVDEINAFVAEIEDFADCIRTHREPISSAEEGKKSLACVLAAYQSMETGQPAYVAGQ